SRVGWLLGPRDEHVAVLFGVVVEEVADVALLHMYAAVRRGHDLDDDDLVAALVDDPGVAQPGHTSVGSDDVTRANVRGLAVISDDFTFRHDCFLAGL